MGSSKPLKLFSCGHDGKFIFGMSIVVASSKRTALKLLKERLKQLGMSTIDNEISCDEIDLNTPDVYVLFDGVY